ncbi:MAG: plastocyanin/azurin family copper-binding protein [Solirubrobacteraceae bacterium]
MHTALQLAPVLAAEKSKVPFFIAGGLLVAWALFISMAVGMRRPNFPETLGQQRAVMAISVVLVLATVSMAVVTSGTPEKKSEASASVTPTPPAETTAPATTPAATTGTPAPPSSPAAAASKLSIAADPGGQLAYTAKTLQAKAGTVSIAMTNMSPLEHNLTIAQGTTVLGATPTFIGGTKTLTLKLKPGVYTFYCSVPGHRQAGMEGTLTVSS